MREVGSSEEDPPEWRIEEDVIGGTTTVTIFDGARERPRRTARGCTPRSGWC